MSNSNSPSIQQGAEAIHFLFVTGLFGYAILVVLELTFPGFVEPVLPLDLLLWAVILVGIIRALLWGMLRK